MAYFGNPKLCRFWFLNLRMVLCGKKRNEIKDQKLLNKAKSLQSTADRGDTYKPYWVYCKTLISHTGCTAKKAFEVRLRDDRPKFHNAAKN